MLIVSTSVLKLHKHLFSPAARITDAGDGLRRLRRNGEEERMSGGGRENDRGKQRREREKKKSEKVASVYKRQINMFSSPR